MAKLFIIKEEAFKKLDQFILSQPFGAVADLVATLQNNIQVVDEPEAPVAEAVVPEVINEPV